jgi:DNA end-binding protein Ku
MARALWTGTISFGLVSVPVRLYPATRRKDVRFHELDRLTGQRIRHQKVVEPAPSRFPFEPAPAPRGQVPVQPVTRIPEPGEVPHRQWSTADATPAPQPVATTDVVKGFEVGRDRYVTVGREELEELAPERSRTIDVQQFVDSSAIDPIYYETSYYAVPERDHERAFGLLVDAMQETKRIAICWFVLRRKRYLAALRPHGRVMVLATLFHADEILPAAELEPAAPRDLGKKEREMAALLINMLSGPFEPERYPDDYRQRLTALIEGRAASAHPAAPELLTGSGVPDLMAALQASVEQARRAAKGTQRAVPRKRSRETTPAAKRKRKTA